MRAGAERRGGGAGAGLPGGQRAGLDAPLEREQPPRVLAAAFGLGCHEVHAPRVFGGGREVLVAERAVGLSRAGRVARGARLSAHVQLDFGRRQRLAALRTRVELSLHHVALVQQVLRVRRDLHQLNSTVQYCIRMRIRIRSVLFVMSVYSYYSETTTQTILVVKVEDCCVLQ